MKAIASLIIAVVLSTSAPGSARAATHWFFGSEGDTIRVTTSDSLVVVSFKNIGFNGLPPNGFKIQVAGLRPDYPEWEIDNGFWVYGLDSTAVLDSVITRLRARPDIGVVNVVASTGSSRIMYMIDEITVRFQAGATPSEIDSIATTLQCDTLIAHEYLENQFTAVISRNRETSTLEMARAFYESGVCEFAEPELYGVANLNSVPNDPLWQYQWHLRNDGGGGQADADIDADSAWLVTSGNPLVFIAVLDGGVEFDHPELAGIDTIGGYDAGGIALDPKYSESRQPDYDPSAACPEFLEPWYPACWHGTAVTGMIFARTNNESGVAGLAPDCRLMPIKIIADDAWWHGSALEDAIYHTFRGPVTATVASCSWNWSETEQYSPKIKAALDSAYSHGVMVVFSSGNDGYVEWPARLPSVVAVGATNGWDLANSWSGKGASLDVTAPGSELWGTDPTGLVGLNPTYSVCSGDSAYYCDYDGTSFSAPLVAGTLGLILSRNTGLRGDIEGLRNILYNSAEDKGSAGYDTTYGHGRINAYRALLSIIRGDMDNNGFVDATDLALVIDIVFFGGSAPLDVRMADFDCNASIDAVDVAVMTDHVFLGGDPPPICFEYDY
ncbi:MAG: S8 family serine peptidase [Candidatus Zixiibacteriota bacterium]